MTAYLRYPWMDSKLEIRCGCMLLFEGRDKRHHGEVAFKPQACELVSLGTVVFDGRAETSAFGQYDDRNYGYGGVRLVY